MTGGVSLGPRHCVAVYLILSSGKFTSTSSIYVVVSICLYFYEGWVTDSEENGFFDGSGNV